MDVGSSPTRITLTPSFLAGFVVWRIMNEAIDNMVESWHTSSDDETRSLQEYLDMNDVEFRIWVVSGRMVQSYLDRHPEMM